MKTTPKSETFIELCKELGERIRASFTENALLCYRAFQAYLVEHPDTAHGKGKGPSFRVAAAKESGVCESTIDALLQVGKAIQKLPKGVQRALVSSSLQNSMRVLRKLAIKKHEKNRADWITTFAKKERSDPEAAMDNLKKKLGLHSAPEKKAGAKVAKENQEARIVIQPVTETFAPGGVLEVVADGYIFQVVVGEIVNGQIRLTAMAAVGPDHGRAAKLLESVSAGTAPQNHSAKMLKAPKKTAKLAA